MRQLFRIQEFLARIVIGVGKLSAWLSIPLMVVIIFDVVTRRFLVLGSTKLQEGEWHIHAVLFLLCIGFTYIEDAHVRIDLLRERLSTRARDWIELIGCIIFVIPYCLIVTYFAEDFVERSWAVGEASDSATGLPYRWAVSYTHLRAHETDSYLVCRLLLEKGANVDTPVSYTHLTLPTKRIV